MLPIDLWSIRLWSYRGFLITALMCQAIKRLQHERVEKLAINLKALLQRWVHGDHDGFKIAQKEEAERLAELSFGKTMLFAIGRVYQNQGQIYEGDIVQSTVARLKQKGESIKCV